MKWAAGICTVFCFLALFRLLGRENTPTGDEPAYGAGQFGLFVEELFREEVKANTVNLHFTLAYPEKYGIGDYEATLGSYSLEDFEKAHSQMDELVEELQKFDLSEFSREQKLTYDILLDYANLQLSAKDYTLLEEVLGPVTGYQIQLPMLLAEYTFRTRQDIEDYLVLVSQVDDVVEEIAAFEKEKSQAGFFMPDYAVDAVISQCNEFIANPEENYMIEIFNDRIDSFGGLTWEEREGYKEENFSIVTTQVASGYQSLVEELKQLKGSGDNQQGLCYYEGGNEYYEYLVRAATGSDGSVTELQERTEEFIENYYDVLEKALFQDTSLYSRMLGCQPSATEPEEILEEAAKKAEEDFPTPPAAGCTVKYVHPSLEENGILAYYLTTPVDDVENNVIYINKKNLNMEEKTQADFYATLVHEGYPGHLYQNVYTASCGLPLIRNLLSYPGYTEGWATYVECEYGFGFAVEDEAVAELLSQSQLFSLAVSSYMDMGIHYDGWSRPEAKEYLARLGIADEEMVDEFYEFMVEEPACYLSYFIGCLEFMDLREKAQGRLGEAFDARGFHQFLLEMGPAPFYVIEEYMEEWLGEQIQEEEP